MRTKGLNLGGEIIKSGEEEIKSPYNSESISTVSFAGPEHLEKAADIAQSSLKAISALPLHERAAILRRASGLIKSSASDFTEAIRDEAGKPVFLSGIETARAQETLNIAAAEAERLAGESIPLEGSPSGTDRWGIVRRFPVGPVLAVSPFNFPLNLVCHKVAPAIAAGCPVVVKPASQTPCAALMLADVLYEAGLPEGGISVVPCPGKDAEKLVTDERFRLLTFTGSAQVGWHLKSVSGKKKVLLELGGNAAAIIGPDADIKKAAASTSVGAFVFAGQVCISVQRIYVLKPVFNEFLDAFVEHTKNRIKWGDPSRRDVICGPLITPGDVDRVMEWIDEAAGSSQVLVKPERHGNVLTPAVLTGVGPDLKISRQELFGPAVVVEEVSGWDEAIERTNDSEFGLQTGVFTNDLKALWHCFEKIEVGGIMHNEAPTWRADPMPYGGVKGSGMGREGPVYAIEEMTEPRLLALKPQV